MFNHRRGAVACLALALASGACGSGQGGPSPSASAAPVPTRQASLPGAPLTTAPTMGAPPPRASPSSLVAVPGSPSATRESATASPIAAPSTLASAAAQSPSADPAPSLAPLHDTIAYVGGSGADAIRLIDPAGRNDRALWTHGYDDPSNVYDVWSLAWNPDAAEVAFASTHENWCSINASDVFVVSADGSEYRRVTQAPACAELADHPKGAVGFRWRRASDPDPSRASCTSRGRPRCVR